jgi:hypothetical protein
MPDDASPPEPPHLSITAADAQVYDVQITRLDGSVDRHRLDVPDGFLAEHGVADSQEPLLVRAVLARVLELDGQVELPASFTLAELAQALPGYPEEMLGLL